MRTQFDLVNVISTNNMISLLFLANALEDLELKQNWKDDVHPYLHYHKHLFLHCVQRVLIHVILFRPGE